MKTINKYTFLLVIALVVLFLSTETRAVLTTYLNLDFGTDVNFAEPSDGIVYHSSGGSGSYSIDPNYKKSGTGSLKTNVKYHYYCSNGGDFSTVFDPNQGTVEMWVSPDWNAIDGVSGQVIALVGTNYDYPYSANRGIHLTLLNGGWMTAWYKGNGSAPNSVELQAQITTSEWTQGSWHHVAFTWDSNDLKLYLDEEVIASANNPSPSDFLGQNVFNIGGPQSGVRCWDGWIDEIKVYNHVKTFPESNELDRQRICLNEVWDFHPIVNGAWDANSNLSDVNQWIADSNWIDMRVPGVWKGGVQWYEYSFFNYAMVNGDLKNSLQAWYMRDFNVPASWEGQNIRLEFGRVGYRAEVYVNRNFAGLHVGAVTPFELDITDYVDFNSTNELLVFNTSLKHYYERPKEGPLTPLYKYSGISGDVYLHQNPKIFVNDVFVKTSVQNDKITSVVEITNTDTSTHIVDIENIVMDNNNVVLALPIKQNVIVLTDGNVAKVSIEENWSDLDPNLIYWSPDNPHLYSLVTRIKKGSVVIDEKTTRFGFREMWADGKNFVLNNNVIRVRTFPLVDLWPQHLRPEWLRGWYTLMKEELGYNGIRFFAPLPDICAEIADEVGLFVEEGSSLVDSDQRLRWNWTQSNETVKAEFGEWIRAHRNHPSIVLWTTENECWSMKNTVAYEANDVNQVGIYNWLLGLTDWITAHDNTRIITNHNLGDMFDWTESYYEDYLDAGDLIGKANNYNLHYPREYRVPAEQIELVETWKGDTNYPKPLLIGEFSGVQSIVPGVTADFLINGEDFVKGGTEEGKAMYYLFRRVVGGWRAMGLPWMGPWWPNITAVKELSVGGQTLNWGDMSTPYMKPNTLRWFAYNPSEWGLTQYPEYIPDNNNPNSNNKFWELCTDTLAPLLVNFGGNFWEHNYLSGESIGKTAYIINDTNSSQNVTWSWELKRGETVLDSNSGSLSPIGISDINQIAFTMQLPTVTTRDVLTLIFDVNASSFISTDSMDICVYPNSVVAEPNFPTIAVALYDSVGDTNAILTALNIGHDNINDFNELSNYNLLIIGANSADSIVTSSFNKIRDFVYDGNNLIVFEQGRDNYANLNGIFIGIKTSQIAYGRPSYTPSTYADIGAPGHPIFENLEDGICNWQGEYGKICEFAFPRPFGISARSLLFSGRWGTSLVEGFHGNGKYLLCQAYVTPRYDSEPEATILMHNMLDYAMSSFETPSRNIAYVGEVNDLFYGAFDANDVTSSFSTVDLSSYDILVLGREIMAANSVISNNPQKVLDFAMNGGTVFILPQDSNTFEGDWLPGKVALRDVNSQYVFKEDVICSSIWGLSAFDLTCYYTYGIQGSGGSGFQFQNTWSSVKIDDELYDYSSNWTSLLLVSNEPNNWNAGDINEPVGGVYPTDGSAMIESEYGNGRFILCQINMASEANSVDPNALAGGEVPLDLIELAPRLTADALLTNMVCPPSLGSPIGVLTAFWDYENVTTYGLHPNFGNELTRWGQIGSGAYNTDPNTGVWSGGVALDTNDLTQRYVETSTKDFRDTFDPNKGTIEMWIAPNWNGPNAPDPNGSGVGMNNGDYQILAMVHSTTLWQQGLQIFIYSDGNNGGQLLTYYKGTAGTLLEGSSCADWSANDWHHVAVTWDSNKIRLYLDGLLDASTNNPDPGDAWSSSSDNYYHCGNSNGDSATAWNGKIDDMAIYDYVVYSP